jgi:hypothetical protein
MHVVSLTEKQAMSVVMIAIAKTMAMITAMREKQTLKPLKKGSFTSLAIIKKGDLVIPDSFFYAITFLVQQCVEHPEV